VDVAAVNGPGSVVISGERDAVESVAAVFGEQGHRTRRLTVSHAFHSVLMEPMLAGFRAVAETVTFHPARTRIVSTLTGRPAEQEMSTADYWVDQIRGTVRFADAVAAIGQECATLVELGPDGVLCAMAREVLGDSGPVAVPMTRRDRPEPSTAVSALAKLFTRGATVDWAAVLPGNGNRIALPTYPFDRKRYWLTSGRATDASDAYGLGQEPMAHPLVSAVIESPDSGGLVMTGRASLGWPSRPATGWA
jgi:acyl transferase domain-containing protein